MIETLKLYHLRGLEEVSLTLGSSINLFVGANGAGKTSVLEAVTLLSHGRSFVTARAKSLIHFDANELTVYAKIHRTEGSYQLGCQVRLDGDRRLKFNGVAAKGQAELSRVLPVITIAPHCADLVIGSPGDRRRFLDWGAFYCANGEMAVYAGLRKVLLQRNAVLRSGKADKSHLDSWDQQIVAFGVVVDRWRAQFLAELEPVFSLVIQELGVGLEFELRYQPGWRGGSLSEALAESRARDIRTGVTQVGPHRADFCLLRGERRASESLSRGQLRAVNLAMVLAQLRVAQKAGVEPLVCMDDPGAELDGVLQASLWEQVLKAETQVLVTAISVARAGIGVGTVDSGAMFHVKHGKITNLKEE